MGGTMAGVSLILVIFLVVLAILWMLVPFLIMGTNNRLEKVIKRLTADELYDPITQIYCPECCGIVQRVAKKCRHCASPLTPSVLR